MIAVTAEERAELERRVKERNQHSKSDAQLARDLGPNDAAP
ncbi:hypothetical protein [Embleya sp. NBC_00896]|nr:hypothetical protein OG928_48080 [Embleya sp. NBC_00896]